MQIKILYFAILRERLRRDEEVVVVDERRHRRCAARRAGAPPPARSPGCGAICRSRAIGRPRAPTKRSATATRWRSSRPSPAARHPRGARHAARRQRGAAPGDHAGAGGIVTFLGVVRREGAQLAARRAPRIRGLHRDGRRAHRRHRRAVEAATRVRASRSSTASESWWSATSRWRSPRPLLIAQRRSPPAATQSSASRKRYPIWKKEVGEDGRRVDRLGP